MLIRPTGRHDGVKSYLEDGRKKEREQSRDQLDERIILAGDLEVTDAIIQSIQAGPDVDRYLHITLSFKEDEVPLETLYAAVEDFRKFVYASYRPAELNFYAEAHVPKLKSYADRKSGAPVERKPHVHIVIPKLNMITGNSAEPLGYVRANIPYIDAIQEDINAKYGFASPKENRRTQLTDSSDMLSRYKGDLFAQNNRNLKTQLLDAVLDRKIESYDDFVLLLKEHGATRLRNAGHSSEYPNVKLPGDAKGINLKESVFSRDFIALPTADKLQQLGEEIKPVYETPGARRESAATVQAVVDEWFAMRARESKYLNSGNKAVYDAYRAATPADRVRWLDEREHAFYTKHLGENHESRSAATRTEDDRGDRRLRRIGRVYEFKRGPARALDGRSPGRERPSSPAPERPERRADRPSVANAKRWEWGASRSASGPSAESLNGVRSLSSVSVVRFKRRSEVLLPDHAPGVVEHQRAKRAHPMRWDRDRERDVSPAAGPWERHYPAKGGAGQSVIDGDQYQLQGNRRMSAKQRQGAPMLSAAPALARNASTRVDKQRSSRDPRWRGREVRANGRLTDSVVSQQRWDSAEGRERLAAQHHPDYAHIRRGLSARRLLGELSHSHGVLPEKYLVVRAKDGSERIRAGTRHLNVSDFLTKELNLPWREAGPMLREAYARQQGDSIELPARENPRVVLWQAYSKARDDAAMSRRAAWSEQRAEEQRRRVAIKVVFETKRDAIRTDPTFSMRQRRSNLSVARMERVGFEAALRNSIFLERQGLQAKHGSAAGLRFADYLRDRAQKGYTLALSELRRTRRTLQKKDALIDSQGDRNEIRPINDQRNEIIYRRASFTHHVQDNGDVSYRLDGRDVVHDRGTNILVMQRDQDTVEAGLRLAMAKYGTTLKLSGDETFKREAVRVAAAIRLNVRFSDDSLNRLMTQCSAQNIADRFSTASTQMRQTMMTESPQKPERDSQSIHGTEVPHVQDNDLTPDPPTL